LRARHRPLDPGRAGNQQPVRRARPAGADRELKIKISGCINACGHRHVGHLGILGLDKQGEEFYQITLGGSADGNAAIGKIVGPGFSAEQVPGAVERIVEAYLELRAREDEPFIEVYRRSGDKPFKERLYAAA
jgi:sulfite reductase (NADPH) hemoprotein beta-component